MTSGRMDENYLGKMPAIGLPISTAYVSPSVPSAVGSLCRPPTSIRRFRSGLRPPQRNFACNLPRRPHTVIHACTEPAQPSGNDPDELAELAAKELRWREIDFESLESELAAIDGYAREEELPESDAWPIFLRGAAYEHWGRPRLALAQYDLVRHSKGILLVPDLWMRKAYNAFKVGDVVIADAYHEIAAMIRAEAVGNQMHFSFWFEEHFADFKPRHNGPMFPLQCAICRYCVDKDGMAYVRACIAPLLVAKAGASRELQHAALWMLAACARLKSKSEPVVPSDLPVKDLDLLKPALETSLADEGDYLASVSALFLGSPDALGVAESTAREGGEHALAQALYLALYHDAFTKDDIAREKWLDIASGSEQPDCTNGYEDFLYFVAKNRLAVPPDSDQDRAAVAAPF